MEFGKRVLFTCSPYWLGGPTTWLRRACECLPQHGWTCKVVLPGTRRAPADDWSRWPSDFEILRPVYSAPALVHSLSSTIEDFGAEVVLNVALDSTPNAVRLLRRKRAFGVKYIDCLHNDNAFECERLRNHVDVIDAVAVPSEGCRQRINRQIPELANKVRRFWCPAPCELTISRDYRLGPLKLVYLGRLFQYGKRILDLVPVCEELVKRNVNFELTVIGDGPERRAVEAGIASLRLIGKRVRFMGWLPNRSAMEVLKEQHLLLMFSDLEGQPIAMLEAMGCGVVPVVTDIPALREVIEHGQSGFLVRVGDAPQFASTLVELAGDRQRLECIAEGALLRVRSKWETGVAVSKLSDVLNDVLSTSGQEASSLQSIHYLPSRMTELGIPHALQGIKRRLLRQGIVY